MTTGPTNTTTAPLTPADHGEAVNGLTKAIELADTAAAQYEQNAKSVALTMNADHWKAMAKDARDLRARLTLALSVVKASPPAEPNIKAEAHPWFSRVELVKWITRVERELGTKCIWCELNGIRSEEAIFKAVFSIAKPINWSAFATKTIGVEGQTPKSDGTLEVTICMCRPKRFPIPGPKDQKPAAQIFDRAFGGGTPTREAEELAGDMSAHLTWAAVRMADEAEHLERLAAAAVDCGARADMIRAKINALLSTAAQLLRAAGVIDAMDHPAKALPACRAMAIAKVERWIWVPSSGYQLEGYEWLTDYRIEGTELKKADIVTNP